MSYAEYLRELLRPLGVYDLSAPFNGGELDAQGWALDGAMDWLEEVQRETSLTAGESWGLEKMASLFVRRPVADHPRKLAAALAALLRIGGDSFTLDAINDTITGCGIPAVVKELGKGQVSVSFPGVAGEPKEFQKLKKIIEDILPAHLGIEYDFWFLTWQELEDNFPSWQSIEDMELSWTELETFVEYL
ncbi:MAG: DUF2313 domain-containing protein [Lawsonibacter sp.]|nr:DUF2313 domain-containing protein [Lawsonibacter sp.]